MGLTVGDVETFLATISDKNTPISIEIPDGSPASFTVPGYTFKPGAHLKPLEFIKEGVVVS